MANGTSPDKPDLQIQGVYTDEEKKEILATIDKVVASNRLDGAEGNLIRFPARKRGLFFVAMVNVMAVVLVVGGWVFADWFFRDKVEGLKQQTNQIFSTEGRLLAKLMEESKAQLEAKNKELEKIQGDLSNLEGQKNKLLAEFDSKLSAKETELKASLEAELAAERKRLQGAGVSEAEIAAKLKALEAQKAAETQRALDEFKRANQAEIDARNRELEGLKGRLQSISADQEKLKTDLESKAKERESNLQSQLNKQNANLDKLTREADAERLFNRQVETELGTFQGAMERLDYDSASSALTRMEALAQKGLDSEYEAVKKRAQSDWTLAVTLTKAVKDLEASAAKVEPDPAFEAFKSRALRAQEIRDPVERAAAFGKAAEQVPEVQAVVKGLNAFHEQKIEADYSERIKKAETDLKNAATLSEAAAALKARNEALLAKVTDLEAALAKSEKDRTAAVEQQVVLQAKVDDLEKQVAELKTLKDAGTPGTMTPEAQAALETRIKELEGQLTESQKVLEEKIALEAQVAELKTKLAEAEKAASGLSDAEVAELRAKVADFETKLKTAETTQKDLETKLTASDTAKTELTAKLTETETAKTDLEKKLAELQAKMASDSTSLTEKEALWKSVGEAWLGSRDKVTGPLGAGTPEGLQAAEQAFAEALGPNGDQLFPGFRETYRSLTDARNKRSSADLTASQTEAAALKKKLDEPVDPTPFRAQAFNDVLTLTKYLAGDADKALAARDFVATIAKNEPSFKTVAEQIQNLAKTGAKESLIRTVKTGLLGPLVTLSGSKAVAEIFTSLKPEAGQNVEIRRNSSKGDAVLAQGKVSAVNGKRVEIEITTIADDKKKPISGDVVYLELK